MPDIPQGMQRRPLVGLTFLGSTHRAATKRRGDWTRV